MSPPLRLPELKAPVVAVQVWVTESLLTTVMVSPTEPLESPVNAKLAIVIRRALGAAVVVVVGAMVVVVVAAVVLVVGATVVVGAAVVVVETVVDVVVGANVVVGAMVVVAAEGSGVSVVTVVEGDSLLVVDSAAVPLHATVNASSSTKGERGNRTHIASYTAPSSARFAEMIACHPPECIPSSVSASAM